MRQMMCTSKISADALGYLAKYDSSTLPNRTWAEVDESLRSQLANIKGVDTKSTDHIPWNILPLRTLHLIRETHNEWSWPSWDAIPNEILLRFSIIRTPLDRSEVPPNIIIMLANRYPEVLPPVDWSHFGRAQKDSLKKSSQVYMS